MTTITGYRIQTADRDPNELLDPAEQVSRAWHREDIDQPGVSVCETLSDLAAYLAVGPGQGIPYGAGQWVIVELHGEQLLDRSHDEEHGERLVRPTKIVSVDPMGDEFFDMIAAAFEQE